MTTKRIPSVIPFYVTGLIWVAYACFLPLYRWHDFVIAAAISAVCFFVAKRFFPGEEIVVETPVDTGDAELDAIIRQGRDAIRQMRRLNDEIKNDEMSSQIDELERITARIFKLLEKEPNKITQVRTFLNYYLPTTIKLLTSYRDLANQNSDGANIQGSMHKIEQVLGTIMKAFQKELDGLFAGKAMDISAEIKIMESMMNDHGFDFKR